MFQVRFGTAADAPAIQKIAYATWPAAYGSLMEPGQLQYMLEKMYALPELTKQLDDSNYFFLIAEDAVHSIVGFAAASLKENNTFHLHKLYVLPGFHKQHCGSLLLSRVIKEAKMRGGIAIELNVKRDNPAKFFYEKQGFEVKETVDINIGEGYYMRDFIMRKIFDRHI